MKNISRTTIYINISASVLFSLYFILSSIKPIDDKKKEIELENKKEFLQKIRISEVKDDLIIKEVTLPEFEKNMFNSQNSQNLKLTPVMVVHKNKNIKTPIIKPIKFFEVKVQDLDIKPKKLSILSAVSNEEKIRPKFINPINKISINIKDKINRDNKLIEDKLNKLDKSLLIENGNKVLGNVQNDFLFEFRWPLETKTHDTIYQILNQCLFSQTVLLNKKNQIFGINGLINRNDFSKRYSSIIRKPNNVYSNKEKNIIKQIRIKYLENENGRPLRIFEKNSDAYIIGYLFNIAKRNNLKLRKIKGEYIIINNELFLHNLNINDKEISNKILLSQFNKKCYI
jgi:hypothetical protein